MAGKAFRKDAARGFSAATQTSTLEKPMRKCVKSIQNVPSFTPVRSLPRDDETTSAHLADESDQSPVHSPTPCGFRIRRSRVAAPAASTTVATSVIE